jgi:hypothetical protein
MPEYEPANFLLSADIAELNVNQALLLTDSLASLFVQPFDAVVLHVIDGQAKDVFVISDPPHRRIAFFICSEPNEGVREIERMGVYRGEDIDGLKSPSGLATNAVGRLYDPDNDLIYVADMYNDRILELVFRPEEGGYLVCNRVLAAGYLEWPLDVAIANFGMMRYGEDARLFVVGSGHEEDAGYLAELDFDGNITGMWHTVRNQWNWTRELKQPYAVACLPDTVEGAAAVFVSEQSCNAAIRLSCAMDEEPDYTWEQLLELGGPYWQPGGIAFDDYGRVYVVNQITHKIEIYGPHFEYVLGMFGEPGMRGVDFKFPKNIITDTYHGFCEALILERYARNSGIQTLIIVDGVSGQKIEQGFYAHNMVKPHIREGIRLPVIYSLKQAYPNPFNDACRISYDVPERCHVTIDVFDIMGRKVTTLVNEDKEPGSYSVTFKARRLSSGVYLYRLTAGDFRASRSVIYLK